MRCWYWNSDHSTNSIGQKGLLGAFKIPGLLFHVCRCFGVDPKLALASWSSIFLLSSLCYLIFSKCHRYVSMKWINIASGNGLSPVQRQAITSTNAVVLSTGSLGTNLSEIRIKIQNFYFKKMHLKPSSAKWWPFCPGGDELIVSTSFSIRPRRHSECKHQSRYHR